MPVSGCGADLERCAAVSDEDDIVVYDEKRVELRNVGENSIQKMPGSR